MKPFSHKLRHSLWSKLLHIFFIMVVFSGGVLFSSEPIYALEQEFPDSGGGNGGGTPGGQGGNAGEGENESGDRGLRLPFDPPLDYVPEDPDFESEFIDEGSGSEKFAGVIISVVTFLKYIAGVIAFAWFIWAAVRMVTAGDSEEQAKESMDGMKWSGVALLFIVLVEPLIVDSLYGGGDFNPGDQFKDAETAEGAVSAGKRQIIALIDWVKALAVFLGVAFLIFSSWKFLQDTSGEEEVSKQKEVLLWMAVGFIVMAINEILIDQVLYQIILSDDISQRGFDVVKAEFTQDPTRGIQEFVGVMKYFLQFLGVLALAAIVYAGFLMITGFTSEENYEKGKKILLGAFIGFLLILLSYLMVSTVITGSIL